MFDKKIEFPDNGLNQLITWPKSNSVGIILFECGLIRTQHLVAVRCIGRGTIHCHYCQASSHPFIARLAARLKSTLNKYRAIIQLNSYQRAFARWHKWKRYCVLTHICLEAVIKLRLKMYNWKLTADITDIGYIFSFGTYSYVTPIWVSVFVLDVEDEVSDRAKTEAYEAEDMAGKTIH